MSERQLYARLPAEGDATEPKICPHLANALDPFGRLYAEIGADDI
jgi:hypothetical protein